MAASDDDVPLHTLRIYLANSSALHLPGTRPHTEPSPEEIAAVKGDLSTTRKDAILIHVGNHPLVYKQS